MAALDGQVGSPLLIERDGARLFAGAATEDLVALRCGLANLPADRAGVRLHGVAALRSCLSTDGTIGGIAARMQSRDTRPVRAVLFDKTAGMNWSLAWHQDRTICVKRRIETAGFGSWTTKAGMLHVAPPDAVLRRMVTIRVHLDDVGQDNAPLLIAPGSHRLGQVPESEIDGVVAQCGTRACLAFMPPKWL